MRVCVAIPYALDVIPHLSVYVRASGGVAQDGGETHSFCGACIHFFLRERGCRKSLSPDDIQVQLCSLTTQPGRKSLSGGCVAKTGIEGEEEREIR